MSENSDLIRWDLGLSDQFKKIIDQDELIKKTLANNNHFDWTKNARSFLDDMNNQCEAIFENARVRNNPAQHFVESLVLIAEEIKKSIDQDHELAIIVSNGISQMVVETIVPLDPGLIRIKCLGLNRGDLEHTEVVSHISNVSIQFKVLKKNKDEPKRRIGFSS